MTLAKQRDCLLHIVQEADNQNRRAVEAYQDFTENLAKYIGTFSAFNKLGKLNATEADLGRITTRLDELHCDLAVIWNSSAWILPKECDRLSQKYTPNSLVLGCRYHRDSIVNFSKKDRINRFFFRIKQVLHLMIPENNFGLALADREAWNAIQAHPRTHWVHYAKKLGIRIIFVGVMWKHPDTTNSIKR